MSDQSPGARPGQDFRALGGQARFHLSEFVLGYLEEAGSVVMPPEFGVCEVLMPEEIAAGLSLDEHIRLAFTPSAQSAPSGGEEDPLGAADAVLRLSVNHPLVENIAQTITRQPANVRTFIRGVRTEKRGLAELARQHFGLANARMDELPATQEEAVRHHYLLCNFKITLLSEEKREELAVVVMDVQAGHAVDDPVILQRLEIIDPEPAFAELPVAPLRWQEPERAQTAMRPEGARAREALALDTLQALLPRAEATLRDKLADQIAALAARMERQLMLDLARINDFYDEMTSDLQRRQARLSPDNAERGQGLADKLVMLEAERTAKLADARSRYTLHIEMQLVNVLLATQPKVILPMSISNRTSTITRTVVWDPLVHRLEPLVCDVCGQPGERLHLCAGGHLAHAACLAPQCVDCRRAFCRLCAAQIAECVVCHRPVCRPSLIQCPTCGRGTCGEHQQLCHAAGGRPAILPEPAPSNLREPSGRAPLGEAAASIATARPSGAGALLPPAQPPAAKPPARTRSKSGAANSAGNAVTMRGKAKSPPAEKPKPTVKGIRVDVQIYEEELTLVAFVMRSTNRVLATRSFRLTPQGILVHCQCEKDPCPAHGYFYRPASPAAITEQIAAQLRALQQEYFVPSKKVNYYYQRFGQIQTETRFVLPPAWHDPARLTEAQRGFDHLGRE
ncbi:MAG: hypothetical protein IT328_27295 [Caldilineaceae bacterium]|nr:hypothetical protein [Caldilineaceae bacterium]